MIAELGFMTLCWALICAGLLVAVPWVGLHRDVPSVYKAVNHYVRLQCFCVALAYACLTVCFLRDDFSVTYVLTNSSLSLPWFYKLCAVWGGHEGSMLLWVLVLNGWMLVLSFMSQTLEDIFRTRVFIVLGLLNVGFLLFLLIASNPFARQFQILDSPGRDLNPLLQDPGFLFHPPMLYMGYVGFSVAFAFAIAALWSKRVETTWARWARPWTLAAWCCLTIGITLGSWWAYRELGWGGWWFWDPVENASFMPWLVGTALIHALMVSEKRQQFVAWTVLLSIGAFSLSLIGTFLVRSGVLTSVHAFAVDPLRGLAILIFLLIVIGGALILFACRAQGLTQVQQPDLVSRESALLLNSVLLAVAMLSVLLGTIYPLLIDGLGLGKLSVGAPYFNTVFTALMLPLFVIMGLGVQLRWQHDSLRQWMRRSGWIVPVCLLLPTLSYLLGPMHGMVYLGLVAASWIFISTILALWLRVRHHGMVGGLSQAYLGMVLAHLGVGVTVLGITISSGFGIQEDVKWSLGETIQFAHKPLTFVRETALKGPNYHGSQVQIDVLTGNRHKSIFPEKRVYDVTHMPMTDAAIDVTPWRDIYVALGEPIGDTAWSVRLYYKPLVRWIWGGGFLMLLGGALAMTDRRYYRRGVSS